MCVSAYLSGYFLRSISAYRTSLGAHICMPLGNLCKFRQQGTVAFVDTGVLSTHTHTHMHMQIFFHKFIIFAAALRAPAVTRK